ncbi:proline--tRNA ligase [candidate division WOR-3 bacterium]|nr:proline--tRNA ligase [candidate division WOR-3 bacterium]
MFWSKSYIPTEKEMPADAIIASHRLLLKGGFIRQELSGAYTYLPLGLKTLAKIMSIVREEMDSTGALELLAPSLASKEIWQATGRWDDFGDDMFRFKDRKGRDLCLAPTHEEIITNLAKRDFRSYRDLPKSLYQLQNKFRDEPRPRSGVLRMRQFIMKDSYSFDRDEKGLETSYNLHKKAYKNIFTRCGLSFRIVSASTGLMGGSDSEEFMIPSESGEDRIVYCSNCSYSANLEVAVSSVGKISYPSKPLEKVNTPVGGSVSEVSSFLGYTQDRMMKSLLWIIDDKPFFLLLCGEDELSETKLQKHLGTGRPAHSDEILKITGAPAGYVGPIGIEDVAVFADKRLEGATGLSTGANEFHHHYINVDIGRDFMIEDFLDLREVRKGQKCVNCSGNLFVENAIEVGHIFKLGKKYSESIGANFTDELGEDKPFVMGSYGIGIERIMASAIEQNHDENGIIWPVSISPFEVVILPLNSSNENVREVSLSVCETLAASSIDFLLDDRDERAGIKFKDADLIGIPLRITVGEKNAVKGMIEIKRRDTSFVETIPLEKTLEIVKHHINELYGLCSVN